MEEKEQSQVVKEENEVLNPDDFEDEEAEEEESDEGEGTESETEEGSQQTSEESESDEEKEQKAKNARAAQRRRREEARQRAEKARLERERKIREDAKLEAELGMVKVNPYTEEPIVDAEDLKIYKLQRELEEEGKDPINDLPKRIALRNREAAKKAQEQAEKQSQEESQRQERINAEIKELRTKYPKVDTAKLASDPLFQECLKGRAGRWTQVEIYEFYLSEKAKAEKAKQDQQTEPAVSKGADKASNPPTSTAKGKTSQKTLEEMTPEEFERYFNEKYNA